jgi:[glutamine synthetase] adenylyltransferase / [glutamine synthetase]-adenylyl-L-tyrosine phosphorylase
MTPDGNLYDVDMRLRPSGTQGPVASSLAAFERYHRELAWTWEQMALTRARVVAGPEPLAGRVRAVVQAVLCQKREPRRLAREVTDMRERMAAHYRDPPAWDVKNRRGGLIDIEFIAQYLQLREAAQHPKTLRQNTTEALLTLVRAGALGAGAARELVGALRLWRNLQGLIKLTVNEPFDEDAAAPALKQLLARGAGAVDFAGLKTDMEAAAQKAIGHYRAIVEAADLAEDKAP